MHTKYKVIKQKSVKSDNSTLSALLTSITINMKLFIYLPYFLDYKSLLFSQIDWSCDL